MKNVIIIIVLCLIIFTFSCGKKEIQIKNGWGRASVIHTNSSIYFNLTNNTDNDEILIGASTDISDLVMLHKLINLEGQTNMIHLMEVMVPKKQTLVFDPKGYHVMIGDLKRDLKPGESINLSLKFKSGKEINQNIQVKTE